mgnify:CR=1 FL=1
MAESQENKKTYLPTSRIANFIRGAFTEAGIMGKVKTLGFIPISVGVLQPGDVIAFNYKAEGGSIHSAVVALVIQTTFSNGTRVNRGTGNRLMTLFKLEDTDDSKNTLKDLYKDKEKSTIEELPDLESFRTYIMNSAHVSNMMELTLDEKAL